MNLNTPNLELVRTCEKPKTDEVDRETPKYEPIRTCEKPKTEKDDREIPKSRPGITFESPNTDKDGKDNIASKLDDTPKISKLEDKDKKIDGPSQKPKDGANQKPKGKSKNKIEPKKIDTKKEPKHKIQHAKFDPKTQPRNKIRLHQLDIHKEPKHRIQHQQIELGKPRNKIKPKKLDTSQAPRNKIQCEKVNLLTPSKNKIKRPTFDLNSESINKIQPQLSKNKIERIPTSEPKNTAKPEVSQLSLEKIKGELKKFNWKTISENWTIKLSANKKITLNPYELPSKENPLYKHKQWLQTVYNQKNWNINDNALRKISGVSNTTIYSWRKKFNIPTKQSNQKLFINGTQKECGRCHQIKDYNEFRVRNDKRRVLSYLRSNCNQCKSELNQIYLFKNKQKILTNIYNGKFKEKCPECETKAYKLPAFDFHHLDKDLKKNQRIRTRDKWSKTMDILEKEKAIPLCKNCHTTKKAAVFNKFKENILRKRNYENHLEGIENNIHQYLKANLNAVKKSQLFQIKSWIKKRIVIEKLYNGSCIGCGEKNLPSLQFHHKNPEIKTYQTWTEINNLKISKIIKKLKEDNAICLCANCHKMTEARHFKENLSEIVGNGDLNELRTFYKRLDRKIKNYSFPNQPEKQINLKSEVKSNNQKILSSSDILLYNRKEIEPHTNLIEKNLYGNLKFQYGYGEAWKKYLSHIDKLLTRGKKVQTKTLAESVGVNTRNTRKNIQKLISKGLITINGEDNDRTIILTDNGKNEAEKFKRK